MNTDSKTYQAYAKAHAKRSPMARDIVRAFWVGGLICVIGELLKLLYSSLTIPEDLIKILIPVTLIFIAGLMTGIGVFDNIAKYAGAGTLVPITGFANSMIATAMDTKSEGMIMGVGAKMFIVAGPVIVYGTVASLIYGVILWIAERV